MQEVDKILYKLGYYDSDDNKKAEIQGYIDEATEFMQECGVPQDKLKSQRAYAIKSIWADCRDRGDDDKIVRKEGMIVALISQLKR
ncbi:MAG: hypothetical protein IJ301_05995 [Clostridia bacterium]|nr:hypothetical protein [Clostridia bacterium]